MPKENEPVGAEKMRQKKFVAVVGQCVACGQPILEGQHSLRSDEGLKHALCSFDPAFAKQVRADHAKVPS
jgi:hypothetical protein